MIWLVGNKGMLGTEVEDFLRKKGLSFVATDREIDITRSESAEQYIHDEKIRHLSWIINCAAFTAVDASEDNAESAFTLNANGPLHLAKTAHAMEAALLHVSTDYVFNGGKEGDYTEDDRPDPISVYGKSKLQGERAVREELDRHVIVRTAWLYGRNGKNFVNTMLRLFQEGPKVRVVADQWGNPTYARDLAEAICKIIVNEGEHWGTFHFTNEGRASWFDFAREIYGNACSLGMIDTNVEVFPIPASEYPTRARRPANSCLSKNKIKRELGIFPRSWQEALSDYMKVG
jgi:dTDP-4-dehydrorhamnose reductase